MGFVTQDFRTDVLVVCVDGRGFGGGRETRHAANGAVRVLSSRR